MDFNAKMFMEFMEKIQHEEKEQIKTVEKQIKKGCDKCSQWDEYSGCDKCERI